jgi:hypothetical protein
MPRTPHEEAERREWWGDKSVIDCPYCFCRFGAETRAKAVKWLNGHIDARHRGGLLGDGKAVGQRRRRAENDY